MSPNLDASTAVAERLKRALMELQLLRLDIESYVERYLEGPK